MIVGAGANIAVQVGEDGVLVVDTGATATDKVLAAIKELAKDKEIRWIVNTTFRPDQPRGNEAFSSAGRTVNGNSAAIVAHENAAARMVAGQSARLRPAVQHLLRGDARLPVQRRAGRALSSRPRSPIRTRW